MASAQAPASLTNKIIKRVRMEFFRPFRSKPEKLGLEDQELKSEFEVMGVEPSWLSDAANCSNDYYMNLLSTLVVGEYDINPETGESRYFQPLELLIDTNMIACARKKNPRISILLQLTMYADFRTSGSSINQNNYRSFLSASTSGGMARQKLQDQIGWMIKQKGWIDGVVVDFPYLPRGMEDEFIGFLTTLKRTIEQLQPEEEHRNRLYLKVPPFRLQNPVYVKIVKQLDLLETKPVDQYIVRAYADSYAEHGSPSWPRASGPAHHGLDSIAAFYKSLDLKPIFEFPYIGYEQTDKQWVAKAYTEIAPILDGQKSLTLYDPSFEYGKLQKERERWVFEDSTTLAEKYHWVKRQEMGGVSLWALGYGKGRKELWQALGDSFGKPTPALLYPGIAFLLMFFGIGVGFANVRYWEVRNALARPGNRMLFVYFMLGLTLLAVLTLWGFFWENSLFEPKQSTWMAGGALLLIFMFPVGRKLVGTVRRYV